jgi:hypothetical protein
MLSKMVKILASEDTKSSLMPPLPKVEYKASTLLAHVLFGKVATGRLLLELNQKATK